MPSADALRRDPSIRRLVALTLTAVAARVATAGSPVVHVDEAFYLTVAMRMIHGAVPYVDVWDRKPVGLFLVYLPAAIWGLPAALYVYQALAGAAAVATAWLVARFADRAGWRATALPAGMLYLLWLDLADGQGGQSPVFYNLPMALAAWLCLDAADGRDRARGIAAMLLVGVAAQIKYTAAFEGIGFGLWLIASEWRRCRSIATTAAGAALLVAAAASPTAIVALVYASLGHLDAFVFADFLSILHRGGDSPDLVWVHVRDCLAILSPLSLALPGWRQAAGSTSERRARWFLRGWLVVALLAFVGFGSWYNHYTLPVMLPGSAAAAATLHRPGRSRWWLAPPLAALFVVGQHILHTERERRGTPAQFAALTEQVGRGAGGLFVYSGPVLLYPATGRPAPTRYIFPSHLEFQREAGSIGVDQAAEIERIFAAAPAVVVMAPPLKEERSAIRALVVRLLRDKGYRAGPPVMLGRDPVLVYRRATS